MYSELGSTSNEYLITCRQTKYTMSKLLLKAQNINIGHKYVSKIMLRALNGQLTNGYLATNMKTRAGNYHQWYK